MEKQVHVSFYASLFRTECKVLTLEEIIILIRRRRWQREIIAYRTALAEGRSEEARRLKGGLRDSPLRGYSREGIRQVRSKRTVKLSGWISTMWRTLRH